MAELAVCVFVFSCTGVSLLTFFVVDDEFSCIIFSVDHVCFCRDEANLENYHDYTESRRIYFLPVKQNFQKIYKHKEGKDSH